MFVSCEITNTYRTVRKIQTSIATTSGTVDTYSEQTNSSRPTACRMEAHVRDAIDCPAIVIIGVPAHNMSHAVVKALIAGVSRKISAR